MCGMKEEKEVVCLKEIKFNTRYNEKMKQTMKKAKTLLYDIWMNNVMYFSQDVFVF